MRYTDGDPSLAGLVNESERPITRRERIGLFVASVVGGAYGGAFITAAVLESLPVEVSGAELGYTVGAGAFAGAAVLGSETLRITRKGFNIPAHSE